MDAASDKDKPTPAESDEDDYLTMTFDKPSITSTTRRKETLTQIHARRAHRAETAGRPRSKAELARRAEHTRTAGLATPILDKDTEPNGTKSQQPPSKGLAMMAKLGYKPGSTLGAPGSAGLLEPVGVEVKSDRGGIGADAEKKRKIREEAERVVGAEKRRKVDAEEYRQRVVREREEKRLEGLLEGARRVAEGLEEQEEEEGGVPGDDDDGRAADEREHAAEDEDTDDDGKDDISSSKAAAAAANKTPHLSSRPSHPSRKPLKSTNILWRTSLKTRLLSERDRRLRHTMLDRPDDTADFDPELDPDDRLALPTSSTTATTSKKTEVVDDADLDESDEELEGFEGKEAGEKLRMVAEYLRERWNYCFWCKFRYLDEEMEGCPGLTEEDHD